MATMDLYATSRSIQAVVSGLENIQTYSRTFTFTLSDGTVKTKTLGPASGQSSVSVTFTGLTPDTGYWVNCDAERTDTGTYLAGWFGSIRTDAEVDPSSLSANGTGPRSIEATLSFNTSVSYTRTFIFQCKTVGGTVLETIQRTVSAGRPSPVYVTFTEGLQPQTTYVITASCSGENYTTNATTTAITDAMPMIFNGTTFVQANPKIYDGTQWKTAHIKIYDGTGWKPS